MPIAAEQVRLLIGPGGTIVREIEQKSETQISMERDPEPCMVVRGAAAGRAEAIRLAKEILAGDMEEAFYVEQRYHGYLIGTHGTRVRTIESDTGTRIQMSATEPVLTIRGSPERRDAAWEQIQANMDTYDAEASPAQQQRDDAGSPAPVAGPSQDE
ncbi:hypothetical protein T484DRAFT_1849786 [Baffinella frigidus]|nr:hypothetical protein T484DRAFT_1849786 [Cryptophyta sp. CCMP2293]